jgi:hypothetical protein
LHGQSTYFGAPRNDSSAFRLAVAFGAASIPSAQEVHYSPLERLDAVDAALIGSG